MQAPAAIAVIRASDLVFEFANLNFRNMVGNRDLEGLSIARAFPEVRNNSVVNVLHDVCRTGEELTGKEFPIYLDWDNGGRRHVKYFNFVFRPVRSHDTEAEVDRVMVVAFDVSEQVNDRLEIERLKEAAEVASKAKTRFLAHMSHEIRTPLSVIMGFADLALDSDPLAEDARHYLMAIKRNGEELTNIIGDVLDLSKIEADKIEIENKNFALNDFLDDIVGFLSRHAREKGLELRLIKADDLPTFVSTDVTRVRQILLNLLVNAIKFTEQGYVALECRCIGKSEPGQTVRLEFTVSDTGIGLSEAQQKNIFQPFGQADSSVNRKYGGTGLGLLLAKQLARLLNGDLSLKFSAPNQGCIFSAVVEATDQSEAKAENAAASETDLRLVIPKKDLDGRRVLIVEDSKDNQILFSRYLQSAGAAVELAQNGEEGVRMAQAHEFDIVLMDIQMPVLDGHSATSLLRERGYRRPIIALTAHAMREEKDRAKNNGFDEYLTKPLSRKVLIENVRKFCH